MRGVAATKAGRVFFRPTAHRLDQLVSKLTGGKHSFAGITAGLPTVILTTTGAKSGNPGPWHYWAFRISTVWPSLRLTTVMLDTPAGITT
jgi:hypothetical protein